MKFQSTKTYNHSVGLSCAFRQWKAASHCRFIHGYALKVHFVFGAQTLDDTNWVVDFGGLKPIKIWLEQNFDHKLLVAEDDPFKGTICNLMLTDIADVRIVKATGMEMVAKEIFDHVDAWLKENYSERVSLESVEVCEHEGNSARVLR